MSLIDSQTIQCVNCGNVFSVMIHSSINVSTSPHLKDDLLEGRLNFGVCPKCKTMHNISNVILYHDMRSRTMIQVLLSPEYSNSKEEAIKEFAEIMGNNLSNLNPTIRSVFETYSYDVVFSIDELKESLTSINESGSDKIRAVTKDVLNAGNTKELKKQIGVIRTFTRWIESFLRAQNTKSDSKQEIAVIPPEKYIIINGVEIRLKYFPIVTKFYEIAPKEVEDTIVKIMSQSNIDTKNALIILEGLYKKATEEKTKVSSQESIDLNIPSKHNFKKDFGSYVKNTGLSEDGKIMVTDNFTPLSLILYPDGLSSITAHIDGMMASFDFYDDILPVFLYIYKEFGIIKEVTLTEMIQQQIDQPIVIRFTDSHVLVSITGMVLTCKLGHTKKSETTGEEFTPLVITEAKIVQKPVGMLVPKSTEYAE